MHSSWPARWGGTVDYVHKVARGVHKPLHLVVVDLASELVRPIDTLEPLTQRLLDPKNPLTDEVGLSLTIARVETDTEPLRVGLRFKMNPDHLYELVEDNSILPQ